MAGQKSSENTYGTYGSVPDVSPNMGATPNLAVRATPQAMGAQVGQAAENAGKEAFDVSQQFQTMATEAKVNDDYANKYAPAAAQLREEYDMLRGQDKVHGYENYISNLQNLNKQFTEEASPLYKQHMSGLIDRHIVGEIDGAKRELVQSQKEFADQSTYELMQANEKYAINNYNNPQVVNNVNAQNDALITVRHIDTGHDPNHPESQEVIENAQRQQKGTLAVGMVNKAIETGDLNTANGIRTEHANVIPGTYQLHIDNVLHQANLQQTGVSSVSALKNGQPIPNAVGAPAPIVQAKVADEAHVQGLDQNHALTILRIESADGQNVGKRGTIGQTGKGQTLDEQAVDLVKAAKSSAIAADKALGRSSEPWEQYICYQQGATGGGTLLRATQDNPAAKAVDLLTDVYGNRKSALSAIVNNGGNQSMTSGDFLSFIRQKYEANAKRAECAVPSMTNIDTSSLNSSTQEVLPQTSADLGKTILEPHIQKNDAVQPAATPKQALLAWEQKAPAMLARINSIPNYEVRAGIMKQFEQEKARYEQASNLYSKTLIDQSYKYSVDPEFTDMSQVPPEVQSALISDHPQAYEALVKKAEYNTKHAAQIRSKNTDSNSSNFYENMQRSLSYDSDSPTPIPNTINNEAQLYKMVGRTDDTGINLKDYSDIKNSIGFDNDRKRFLKTQMGDIKSANGNMDGLGEQRAANFYFAANKMIEEKLANKETINYNPGDKDYIGNLIPSHAVPKEQQVYNMARKIESSVPKISLPSDQLRRPGETPDEYAKRIGL